MPGLDEDSLTSEEIRLAKAAARTANWQRWGPYLSDRQWGTVREDYSDDGNAWTYFPHDHARSRAYRWGEDGLLGLSDRECRLCFSLALWNGVDPILKERLFGLTGPEGNHGEDVKECYYYLESTPTHSYMKALYKYPQSEFPYERLVQENQRRSRNEPEFELTDTGIFDESRYFDVTIEYAKNRPDDILMRLTVTNRGPDEATIHLLPTLWFRNDWSWSGEEASQRPRPSLQLVKPGEFSARHSTLGNFRFSYEIPDEASPPAVLLTENETNTERLYGVPNASAVKDAFHEAVIHGRVEGLLTDGPSTKAAVHWKLTIPAAAAVQVRLRLCAAEQTPSCDAFGPTFDAIFESRLREADAFYEKHLPTSLDEEQQRIARQSYAGLLWSKQFYHFVVRDWLNGDANQPTPPQSRVHGRNAEWPMLFCRDVISMPDKWEYPWFAAWDLAFHMLPMAHIDPEFAKSQLLLMLREWYMHPSGQLPAYEWNFSDVNPPVHAWACWRVYKIAGRHGHRDRGFLERAFHKLLLNFTWWVNRKDPHGRNLFSGGFLGLDNIGVFDRSQPLPDGKQLEQADGTAWMAFYCLTMLSIALELASEDPVYEDVASKFFEHFVAIADAMNCLGGSGLWDEQDGFYYDQVVSNGDSQRLKIRSMVGLIPLFAVEVLDESTLAKLPGFRKRMEWFLTHRQDLAQHISYLERTDHHGRNHAHRLLAIPSRERLERVLRYLLDESEFLSPHGVRSLSRVHETHPFVLHACGMEHCVGYVPGDSNTGMFGGNSNWRGPVWFPVNSLLIEALERFHHFYEDDLKVECPTGSGQMLNLQQVTEEIGRRLVKLFLPDEKGQRPCHGSDARYANDPAWNDLILFYEYFHGDDGRGIGASHQTGWTALVSRLLGCRASALNHPSKG